MNEVFRTLKKYFISIVESKTSFFMNVTFLNFKRGDENE